MTETTDYPYTRDAEIAAGIRQLVTASGTNSRDHGFHDDWPKLRSAPFDEEVEGHQSAVRRAIAEKLALVHEEVSEMLGEIRSGHDPLETYYVDHKGKVGTAGLIYEEQRYDADGTPLLKPEGFLVEAADAIIRLADLAFLVGDKSGEKLAFAQRIKAEYNSTRPYKHGRKF
ncbi:MazG-like nucleotide pyrophosphohydrolase [Arthrobacter phage BruhMoment]|nr:MazG-like nucleotide pyrophosphohydrolase [Arthrobacter phage BruhMoment]